jgi:peroxiredoxin
VKIENKKEGLLKCPLCGVVVVVSERGCNTVTCTNNHSPGYYYFCCHCNQECPGGIGRCACPRKNDAAAREESQKQRNVYASLNPVVL